ncbi:MAG: hypothetical protein GKR98_03120 [Boseongicola sp.]|nr:MAG: hypothetical protein GKR98_03120 [Boseongicola sp.]
MNGQLALLKATPLMQEPNPVLMTVVPSPFRRWAMVAAFAIFAVLLLRLTLISQPNLFGQGFLLAMSVGSAWMTYSTMRATSHGIELTRHQLRTTDGEILADVENIRHIERGALAFKPSSGFTVRLKQRRKAAWRPGLWWRFGTYVGVGGVLSGGQAKAMAEVLSALEQGLLPDHADWSRD